MESKIKEKVLWYKGYNYFIKGDYDKAKEVYNEVINKEHNEYGYLLMGILNKRLNKYDLDITCPCTSSLEFLEYVKNLPNVTYHL